MVTESALPFWDDSTSAVFLRTVVKASPLGITVGDRNGKLLLINPALCTMLGYEEAELLGKSFDDFTHPEDLAQDHLFYQELRNGLRDNYQIEKRYVRKDGHVIWGQLNVSRADPSGNPDCFAIAMVKDVTLRKQAEMAHQESEEQVRLLLECTGDAIYGIDRNGLCTFVNPACLRLAGYQDAQELLGKNMHEVIHHSRADGTRYPMEECSILRTFHEGSGIHRDDEVFWRKDGTCFPAEYRSFPLRREGKVIGAVVSFSDITERRQEQQLLREREEDFAALLKAAPEAIGVLNLHTGLFESLNSQAEQLLAMSSTELEKVGPLQTSPEYQPDGRASRDAVREYIEAALRGEMPIFEWICRNGQGKEFPCEVRLAAMPPPRRHLIRLSVTDITQRKQAEEKLRNSEKRLLTITNSAKDAVILMNDEGNILFWNPAAENIFGYAASEALGKSVHGFLAPARYLPDFRKAFSNWQKTGEGYAVGKTLVLTAVRKGGQEFPIELSLSSVKLEGRWVAVGLVRDITERQRVQQELHIAKENAEAANRAKSEFLANMSHEIRTPMNGILGMTELVLGTELSSEQRRFLEAVRDSGESLLRLLNDILDFSKIEAGKLDFDETDFSIDETIGSVLKTLAVRAHEKGLELTYQLAAQVPDGLVGDGGRLSQVVVNLVSNAIKFTESGEVAVTITADQLTDNEVVLHVAVRDTGIGIDAARQQVIFKPFTQADSSITRRYGGTGLGLTICTRLVERMGGRIWLESIPGQGSTFHFTARFRRSLSLPAQGYPSPPVKLDGLLTLIVDDNATNRTILQELLARWKMRPILADSAATALTALVEAKKQGRAISLVLLDCLMPEMDGFGLVKEISRHESFKDIRLLMLTSSPQHGDATRCRDLGIARPLSKPIRSAELLQAIARVLGISWHPAAKEPKNEPAAVGRRLNILLAEDNLINQQVATHMLEEFGHTVTIAGDGRETVQILGQGSFDLVLMDLQMPEMDGFETCTAIRAGEKGTDKHLPIIALTAHAMKGDRERCLAAGMDDYVSKPIHPEELRRAISRLFPALSVQGKLPTDEVLHPQKILDRDSLLSRLGNNRQRLFQLMTVFQESCPEMLQAIRDAIDLSDVVKVSRAAHTLKGSAGNLGATAAYQTALVLENMGRSGNLIGAAEILKNLEKEIGRFQAELLALSRENPP